MLHHIYVNIGWEFSTEMYSIERKMLILKIVWNSTSYAMDGMCYSCIIKFLYLTLPVSNPPNGWILGS